MPKDEHVETSRVEAFSDGVFAIAITLLVLELHPPQSGDLWAGLIHEWPQFAAYLTSFVIIGIMWANHHSMFRQIVRSDRVLLFLTLLLLLWTSLLDGLVVDSPSMSMCRSHAVTAFSAPTRSSLASQSATTRAVSSVRGSAAPAGCA